MAMQREKFESHQGSGHQGSGHQGSGSSGTQGGTSTVDQVKDFASQTADKAKDFASDAGSKAKDFASDAASKAKDMASSVAQKTGEAATFLGKKAEDAAGCVGGTMKSLAGTIRENTPDGGPLGSAKSAVADTLESGGRYLQEHGLGGMGEDMANLIKRNPIPALLVGIGIGFLVARATSTRS